jgi:hypothetical protein
MSAQLMIPAEPAMFSDQIEKMKREYTDKYVLVDTARPELARFRDVVGRVKTVNMNGRALVEFDDYHLNTGWFDIAPEFLKVVDQPPPKAPKVEKKPAAKAEAKPAVAKAPAKAAPAAGAKSAGKSVADILAAARAGKSAPATPAETAKGDQPAAKPKPATPSASGAPAKVDRSKMSVAEMLAAARGGAAPAAQPTPAKAAAAPAKAAPPAEEPAIEEPVAAAPSASGEVKRVDKSKMSIDDMIAYCREHDAK